MHHKGCNSPDPVLPTCGIAERVKAKTTSKEGLHTTPIFSDGLTVSERFLRTAGRSGAYFTTTFSSTSVPLLDGQYAGGRDFSMIAGAS